MNRNYSIAIAGLAGVILAGCNGSDNSVDGQADIVTGAESLSYSQVIVDASSYTEYTYFNLASGSVLPLTEEEAKTSTEWHIAFRRDKVKVNGGDSGIASVSVALANDQADFYQADGLPDASVFLNASPENQEADLLAAADLSALEFVSDENKAAIAGTGEMVGSSLDMGWYYYNVVNHSISANTDYGWLVRSAEGDSYAKVSVETLEYTSGENLQVNFNLEIQSTGTSQFSSSASFDATIPASGGASCYDFDQPSVTDCSNDLWDLKLEIAGRNWSLWTNGGISGEGTGGAFGPFMSEELAAYSAGDLSPEGVSIVNHYAQDSSSGLFADQPWYAYNLEGRHKLWPNYRVYIIDTDATDENAAKYRLQITSYYSDGGVSGHPNIRFIEN